MSPPSLEAWLARASRAERAGPLALLLVEDEAAVAETVAHQLALGFRRLLVLSAEPVALDPATEGRAINLLWDTHAPDPHVGAVNRVIAAVPPGTWLHYGWNAEFLLFPFCETRRVGEMLAFHAEERRDAMVAYVVDLYPPERAGFPERIEPAQAMFDRSAYYAAERRDREGRVMERQLDFFGGLRWRHEEFLPADRRRIDRVALFRAAPGLTLLADHRFDDEEYNTYACPWHHSLTAAVASFRVAKALASNPRPRAAIGSFRWAGSEPFRWSSQQLMEAGLMEPGQWF